MQTFMREPTESQDLFEKVTLKAEPRAPLFFAIDGRKPSALDADHRGRFLCGFVTDKKAYSVHEVLTLYKRQRPRNEGV